MKRQSFSNNFGIMMGLAIPLLFEISALDPDLNNGIINDCFQKEGK